MATFAQETDNDLKLVGGQLVLVDNIAEEAAIELRNKFQFVKGEYFLDVREGVPYFEIVFVKNPDTLVIKRLFRNIILSTRNVTSILKLETAFNPAARKLSFSFRAMCSNGRIVAGGSGQPFIVEP